MAKTYKGYELINKLTEENILKARIAVRDLSIGYVITNIEYKDKGLKWRPGTFDTSYLINPDFEFEILEIIEEQQDIDIQNIVEPLEIETYECDKTDIRINRETIKKLVQAVKQLDRNIKDKE